MINAKAMGIIFPNMHGGNVPELTLYRTMGSVPFGGRYRMIDFPLSCMANAGMVNIAVIAQENYQSLMDHLETGREWDLARKRGGLAMFPPLSRDSGRIVSGRLPVLNSIVKYIGHRKEDYVVMSDCDIAYNVNFTELIRKHEASGADISAMFMKTDICTGIQQDNVTYVTDDKMRVTAMRINDYKKGEQQVSMNVFVLSRLLLLDIIRDSMVMNYVRFEEDYLAPRLRELHVQAEEYSGYFSQICDMKTYYDENMRLLDPGNLNSLFLKEMPVYTKVRDEAPVRYGLAANVKNCLVADGCIIEGDVENCVLFRSVYIGPGAVLRNCVIGQGSVIEGNVNLDHIVTDKNARIGEGRQLKGADSFPIFVAKGSSVT